MRSATFLFLMVVAITILFAPTSTVSVGVCSPFAPALHLQSMSKVEDKGDDDKGGDPDAYVPQGGHKRNEALHRLTIRGGGGKAKEAAASNTTKAAASKGKKNHKEKR